jgi:hypothetical protein
LNPQHSTAPPDTKAQDVPPPTATAAAPSTVVTGMGTIEQDVPSIEQEVRGESLPSWWTVLLPQH